LAAKLILKQLRTVHSHFAEAAMVFKWWGQSERQSAVKVLSKVGVIAPPYQTEVHIANTSTEPLLLVQFQPAWAEQAYLRFAGIPYLVENSRLHDSANTSCYPQLMDGHFLLPARAILEHIKQHRCDLDADLSPDELADSVAFAAVVQEQLQPLAAAVSLTHCALLSSCL
jgi:Glutathione S-transferase N-terminal domain